VKRTIEPRKYPTALISLISLGTWFYINWGFGGGTRDDWLFLLALGSALYWFFVARNKAIKIQWKCETCVSQGRRRHWVDMGKSLKASRILNRGESKFRRVENHLTSRSSTEYFDAVGNKVGHSESTQLDRPGYFIMEEWLESWECTRQCPRCGHEIVSVHSESKYQAGANQSD
jgi:hypothetical protein